MTETGKAILLIAEILDVLVGQFMPDCGGDFAEGYYYCEKCKDYSLCRKMTKARDINVELQRSLIKEDTGDMYEIDTAYCGGFSDGSGGHINSNPYDPKKDIGLFEQYERGYSDGREK